MMLGLSAGLGKEWVLGNLQEVSWITFLIGLSAVAVVMDKNVESRKSVPHCFVDGLPCDYYGQCEVSEFGVMGNKVVWRCPRLRDEKDKNVLDDIEKKYLKKRDGKFRFGSR